MHVSVQRRFCNMTVRFKTNVVADVISKGITQKIDPPPKLTVKKKKHDSRRNVNKIIIITKIQIYTL